MPGKHGPNRLGNYLQVHESCMADFLAEGFVVQDDSRFTFLPFVVILEGTIVCLDGITLEVRKEIQVLTGRGMTAQVQTRRFRYHAWVRGVHNCGTSRRTSTGKTLTSMSTTRSATELRLP